MKPIAIAFVAVWCAGFVSAIANAGDPWPPIPPEVWAMKEDPAHGTVGAVVLENRIAFLANRIQYTYRVRVLSEHGPRRGRVPGVHALGLRLRRADGAPRRDVGRLLGEEGLPDRDGEDAFRLGHGDAARAPGVTGDCVVELRWSESAQDALGPMPPEYGYFHEWALGGRYRTLVSVVDLGRRSPGRTSWPAWTRTSRR